ncbi:uncharacterized protein DMAD_11263 [Drosophila madeirensis]|uniref:Uncharacterized protein n=1 Tax=Drosophila madeirensis TaxID=30013 RepID=A0AAU9FCJ4_DROMD
MDYLEDLSKRIAHFHCELHTTFGYFIKAASCMAFGVILGWFMSLVALGIYKLALVFGAKPFVLPNDEDDEIEMDLMEGFLTVDTRERQGDAWLEMYWEAQHQHLRTQSQRESAAVNHQSTLVT